MTSSRFTTKQGSLWLVCGLQFNTPQNARRHAVIKQLRHARRQMGLARTRTQLLWLEVRIPAFVAHTTHDVFSGLKPQTRSTPMRNICHLPLSHALPSRLSSRLILILNISRNVPTTDTDVHSWSRACHGKLLSAS